MEYAMTIASIVGASLLVLLVLIVRDWRRESDAPTSEEEMFGTLRPAEPPAPVKYEFIE